MKWFLRILGALFVLVGIVWILQGVNLLPGSFMSGQAVWAVIGIVVGAVGVVLEVLANRRRQAH
jgi:uncharacterized membrane protein HdeD (DUF308 family)